MKLPIYLDYMSTTPVDRDVVEKMMLFLDLDGNFGNPASHTHLYGKTAAEAVERARQQVADLVGCEPQALIWTSGATEANNLAIKGAAHFYRRQGRHIITAQTEHSSVLNPCEQLKKEGFEVTYLQPQENGLLDLDQLKNVLRQDTLLISIMHANNEIGVIQDIAAIGKIAREHGALFHVDAAQSVGKIPIDLSHLCVDLMSLASHKMYGPKGIGALYLRQKPRLHLEPLFQGGEHEMGLRAGTLATHQIVGMGCAYEIAKQKMASEHIRLLAYRKRFWESLRELKDIYVNGDLKNRLPGNLNVSFVGIDGQILIECLTDLAVSSGSACLSGHTKSSHVLRAIGVKESLARSAIRFSFGRFTTEEELDYVINYVPKKIKQLRKH